VVLYDGAMVTQATLPDEAVDMTASELHQYVLNRLVDVLRLILGDAALVLQEMFVRVSDGSNPPDQVSADVMILPGARPGTRTVYRVPAEPVPAVTIEVLSAANYKGDGRDDLIHKRAMFGRIGVRTHIEIDPERGQVTAWVGDGSALVVGEPANRYDGEALGGLSIELEPGQVRLWLPNGQEFTDAATELTQANERAARLAAALRQAGIDPESV